MTENVSITMSRKTPMEPFSLESGLWFEYTPLIPAPVQEGFTPPSIEEATGISSIDQTRLVVAASVRDSLIDSDTHPDVVASFDTGGIELLYEIRLLSTSQRAAAARFLVENRHDAKMAEELPGDCLAFMYFRQALEHKNPSDQRIVALDLTLAAALFVLASASRRRTWREVVSWKNYQYTLMRGCIVSIVHRVGSNCKTATTQIQPSPACHVSPSMVMVRL